MKNKRKKKATQLNVIIYVCSSMMRYEHEIICFIYLFFTSHQVFRSHKWQQDHSGSDEDEVQHHGQL